MAYTINKFSGGQLVVLEDGTIDTSTSLGLVGRNYVGYGETQNENFVFLLENFANDAPPNRPLQGQIWFNTTNNITYVYDGLGWKVIGTAFLGSTSPSEPADGSLWLDTDVNQLKVWTGTAWTFIGPEGVEGFGITRCRSAALPDTAGVNHPVIFLEINGTIIGVCTAIPFTIQTPSMISGIPATLIAGINLSSAVKISGNLTGNAGSATRLENPRLINGVAFDGQSNVTVKSSTTKNLISGTYILGDDFDGSTETTWSVDATSSNVIGKVVARNSTGGFSAGTITADFVGNISGNVTSTGTSRFNIVEANTFVGATLTGNAFSANQFSTARKINGVNFDGTGDITVTAEAGTLTGTELNSTVVTSSLTQVGTLGFLNTENGGINIGSSALQVYNPGVPTIRASNELRLLNLAGSETTGLIFKSKADSLSLGGDNTASIIPSGTVNLGHTTAEFDKIYANSLIGNADTATLATRATNVAGGGAGSIPYQTAANTTAFINSGADGYVLRSRPSGPNWKH